LGNRAAEMAQRVRELAMRFEAKATSTGAATAAAATRTVTTTPEGDGISDPVAQPQHPLKHVFGVTQVGSSVLFAQPAGDVRAMAVAGEFNDWSASATPLHYNSDLNTFEALVPVPPGIYRYRLVADGQW